ncbi:helix-turn-helix transcriptional regulator [Streptomyces xanthii]|uniref:Response regulator transcription factor n=1 Tax=Streptomyces xanthii TaxID=2768069 RepID=A0A7H1BKJ2_9ACTN|nr:response regulator transcription factor [Streptomyces xanthii]QNS09247.1 response regulator transcription factor [Streptomyces xanthii]
MPEAGAELVRSTRLRVLPGGAAAPAPGTVRIFLMGGDALARAGVMALLADHEGLAFVGDDEPGPRALAALRAHRPDVLVVHGPREPHEVAALLAGVDPELPVLTVGGCDPDAHSARLLRGHLPATTTARQLAAAVSLAAAGYALSRGARPEPEHAAPDRPRRVGTRTGQGTGTVSDVPPDTLTDREGQVLDLVSRGLSNTEIAQSLTLSEHTVKTHVQNLLQKLRVRNRVHVAIYAFESGLR